MAYIWEGLLSEGFLRLRFEGANIFFFFGGGGGYYRNFTVPKEILYPCMLHGTTKKQIIGPRSTGV